MLKIVIRWLKNKKDVIKHKKDDDAMNTKELTWTKVKIPSADFEKCDEKWKINRVGRRIYVWEDKQSALNLKDNMVRLKNQIEQSDEAVKIQANGLSRAQVGRIARNLKEVSNCGVYVRRTPLGSVGNSKTKRTFPVSYEILVTRGECNDKK